MSYVLSYNRVLCLLATLALLNAVAKPVGAGIKVAPELALAFDLGSVNPLIIGVFLLSMILLTRVPSKAICNRSAYVWMIVLLLLLVPVSNVSWLCLAILGWEARSLSSASRELKAGAAILIAIALREPISSFLLNVYSIPILQFDAIAVNFWMSVFGVGAERVGNLIINHDGTELLVMTGCASFTNLSYALLLWFSICIYKLLSLNMRAVIAGVALIGLIPFLNHLRLALMSYSTSSYHYIHEGDGAFLFEGATALTTIIFTYWGVRDVKTGPSGDRVPSHRCTT